VSTKNNSGKWQYYGLVFAAWGIYTALTLAAPPADSSDQVHLSNTAIQILKVTLLVPYMLTWLVAVTGWYHFSQFASDTKRKNIPTHNGFQYLSRGLGMLIFDLILVPMLSASRAVWGGNENIAVLLTVMSNYLHIVIPLIAFGFLYIGSRKLALGGHYATGIRSRLLPAFISTALFIGFFSIAVFNNTSRQVAAQTGQFATYYIPDFLIVLTVIIPLAITWMLGLQAALNTERYIHSLLLPEWRHAVVHFFNGLLAVISSAIILQGIAAFGSEQLQQVSLALILVVIYLFIILQAIGYLLIRLGAKQLHRLIKVGTPDETN
jgi:hypothetical protein